MNPLNWCSVAPVVVATLSALVLMADVRPAFPQAQVLNPLFVDARNLNDEIEGSSLNAGIKTSFRNRFNALAAE